MLFWFALVGMFVGLFLPFEIGETDIMGMGGYIYYSWVAFLFLPFGIASLIHSVRMKKQGQKYKKNKIIAFIAIPVLLLFGSYRFLFNNTFVFSPEPAYSVSEKVEVDMPKEIKAITNSSFSCYVTYVKIENPDEKDAFYKSISQDEKWTRKLPNKITNALPSYIDASSFLYDYFLFYNETTNEFNTYPQTEGEYKCVFFAYNKTNGNFVILDDFVLIDN